MAQRICVYGAPGSGKTTLAARIFAELKMSGCEVEHVPEYVKQMALEGRLPQSYDELYLLAKQIYWEDHKLRYVPWIVAECPVMMCVVYAKSMNFCCWKEMLQIAQRWEYDHPALNYFVRRSVEYQPKGRFQTEEEAELVGHEMSTFLSTALPKLEHVHFGGDPSVSIVSFEDLMTDIRKHM